MKEERIEEIAREQAIKVVDEKLANEIHNQVKSGITAVLSNGMVRNIVKVSVEDAVKNGEIATKSDLVNLQSEISSELSSLREQISKINGGGNHADGH